MTAAEQIWNQYQIYREAGSKAYRKAAPESDRILENYQSSRDRLFDSLVAEHEAGRLPSTQAAEIQERLSREEEAPISYWGSEKIARANHRPFVSDMRGRLFETLLNAYLQTETAQRRIEEAVK